MSTMKTQPAFRSGGTTFQGCQPFCARSVYVLCTFCARSVYVLCYHPFNCSHSGGCTIVSPWGLTLHLLCVGVGYKQEPDVVLLL